MKKYFLLFSLLAVLLVSCDEETKDCENDVCMDLCTTLEFCSTGSFPWDSSNDCCLECDIDSTQEDLDCVNDCLNFGECDIFIACIDGCSK